MKDFFQIVQWWTRLCCFLVQLISKVPFLKNLANYPLCSVLRGCRIATSWSNLVQGPHKREKSKQKLFGSANLKSCFFEQILSNYPFCSVRGYRTASSWSNLVPGPHEREKTIEYKLFGSAYLKSFFFEQYWQIIYSALCVAAELPPVGLTWCRDLMRGRKAQNISFLVLLI